MDHEKRERTPVTVHIPIDALVLERVIKEVSAKLNDPSFDLYASLSPQHRRLIDECRDSERITVAEYSIIVY